MRALLGWAAVFAAVAVVSPSSLRAQVPKHSLVKCNGPHSSEEAYQRVCEDVRWAIEDVPNDNCARLKICTTYTRAIEVPGVPVPVPVRRLCSTPLDAMRRAKAAREVAKERGEAGGDNDLRGWNLLAIEYAASTQIHNKNEANGAYQHMIDHGGTLLSVLDDEVSVKSVMPQDVLNALRSFALREIPC